MNIYWVSKNIQPAASMLKDEIKIETPQNPPTTEEDIQLNIY